MNYFSMVLLCLVLMLLISGLMYMLGRKIAYNYILYNAVISLSVGVMFFLGKQIYFEANSPIERAADVTITIILLVIWVVALVETLIVEVMENGNEHKITLRNFFVKIKSFDVKTIKSIPGNTYRFGKQLLLKIKDLSVPFKIKEFIQKRYNKLKERF